MDIDDRFRVDSCLAKHACQCPQRQITPMESHYAWHAGVALARGADLRAPGGVADPVEDGMGVQARCARLFRNGRSHALSEGCALVTADQAFAHVADLHLEGW